jgi:hypothetical protein
MYKGTIILLSIFLIGCQTCPPPVDSRAALEEKAKAAAKATQEVIEAARQEAFSRYLDCRASAESAFNHGLETQGKPTPGKKDMFTERVRGDFEKLKQQENFDDTECRKVYEAELALLQPRVQQQDVPVK